MNLKIKIKDKEYNIEVVEEDEKVKVLIDGKEFVFDNEAPKEEFLIPQTAIPKRDFSKKEIMAPLAGVALDVFVKEGDFVKPNQRLLILSAMKMENEIVAEFEGKIKKVLISKDQKVKEGDILIEFY